MSSVSQLTTATTTTTTPTSETKINPQNNSLSNLRTLPCDGLSNFFHLSASPSNNSKYLYYVNAQPTISNQSLSTTITPLSQASTYAQARLSTVPWYKRTRSPSTIDEKSISSSKMSRDRLLPLEKLFHHPTQTATTDEEQPSPTNDLTPLDGSIKFNENTLREMKENGHLRSSSHLATR